jgi:catechol 2,3-dioxygenase-like lactoylglutathione lyase family enzyme
LLDAESDYMNWGDDTPLTWTFKEGRLDSNSDQRIMSHPSAAKEAHLDWKLEVVTIPVSDMDRAKAFYAEKIGFKVDIDHQVSDDVRFLQLTPPGSACSIHLGHGTDQLKPGSMEGLFLVVADIRAARDELVGRGADVGEILVFDSGEYRAARQGESLDLVGVVFFTDPDGNRWMVQQIPPRE